MASLRLPTIILAITVTVALMLGAAALPMPEPQPFNLGKAISSAYNKVKKIVNPYTSCLKNAGATDVAMGWFTSCGQDRFYGKTAMAACAANTYAPADVKKVAGASLKCFH